MAERRIINGFIVERQPDGTLVTIGPATPSAPQGITIGQRNPTKVAQDQADLAHTQNEERRAQAEFERKQREYNATHYPDGTPKEAEGALSKEAIIFNAQQYLSTGVMPTLGMGKQAAADREAILNEAARQAGAGGLRGEDLARQIAHYKAGTKQLQQLESQLGTIRSNEQAALANGKLFLDLSSQAPGQTRFPLANSAIQGIAGATGNKDVAAMNSAWQTFTTEYAKVIAGSPTGAGTLSDSARHEAQDIIRSNAAPEQKAAALAAMQQDMDNRIAAIHSSINDGYKNLTEKPGYQVPDSTSSFALPPEQRKRNEAAAGINPVIGGLGDSGGPPPALAGGGDGSKSLPIPPEYQADHAQYLAQHWGHIDPNDYANFRASEDQKFGFAPRMDAYKAIVPDLNKRAQQGGSPQGLNIPPVNAQMNGLDKFNATLFNNQAGAAVLGAGSLGGGMDEVAGTLKSAFTGRPVSEEIARANAIRQAAANQYGPATTLGNIAGTGALAAATGGAGLLADSPILAGMGYGAVNGALENNDSRLGGAIGGAALGGFGGAGGKYLLAPAAKALMDTGAGQAASRAGRSAINKAGGLFGSKAPLVADQAIVPSFATGEKMLPGSDTLLNAKANLQDAASLNLPYALADADPKLRMLAGSVARYSPDAASLAERILTPRSLGQADRAVQGIDTHLAPITNIEQRGADLLKAGDQAAGPSYNLARARPGPVDPQVDAMLRTPAGQSALNKARTIAANEGRDPNKLGFDLNDQGEVVLKSVPSFETLQLVKRGFDSTLEDMRDPVTRQLNLRGNPLAQSVNDLRGRFVGRLGELNPDYAEGNKIWQGFAQRKDALDQGYGVLPNNGVPFRQFEAGRAKLTPDTLPEAQMGYATNMADTVNRVRETANPYNSIYGSPLQQQKVAAMFPEGVGRFDRLYNLEKDMGQTYGEVLRGSQTQPRALADARFASEPAGMAVDAAMALGTGGATLPITAARLAAPKLRDKAALAFSKKKADALAPVLFNTDPAASYAYIDDLARRKALDELRKQTFQRGYGLFGAIGGPSLMPPS